MFAFWYPFADSLEVVPGFADDGPLGALLIATIALAFTCLIGEPRPLPSPHPYSQPPSPSSASPSPFSPPLPPSPSTPLPPSRRLIGLIARWVDQFATHDLPAAKGESSARGLRKGRLMVSRRWLLLTQPRAPCASLDGGPPQLQCGAMIARNI